MHIYKPVVVLQAEFYRNFGGPREMTKAICSDCGKECEVPFKPTEGRPVYCQDCLPKHRKPRF